jgi:hypothetical protein
MPNISSLSRPSMLIGLLCLGTAVQAANGIDFKVVNSTPDVIREIYVCPTGAEKWGANLLRQPLKPGQSVSLTFEGACGAYDIRMVAPDGKEYMDDEVEFCEPDDVMTVSDGALKKRGAREVGEGR